MANALALGDDEGRGKLRKAMGSCKQALIHRCPNGETPHILKRYVIAQAKKTQGTETSKYLEEERTISDSASSGERTRKSPKVIVR